MAIPTIYRGDDTDFRDEAELTLKVKTAADLAGCTIEMEFLGHRKVFPVEDGGETVCAFVFSAKETAAMPLGVHSATVRLYDAKGRVRTVNNSIRVKVTDNVAEAYGANDPNEVTLGISTGEKFAFHEITPEETEYTTTFSPLDGKANFAEACATNSKRFIVKIPEATNGVMRRFMLSIFTDAEIEVEWQNAMSIIEAFPGAKNIPSFPCEGAVWSVFEVSPECFVLDRIPREVGLVKGSYAMAYALSVDDDGVLEVKRAERD